MLHFQCSHCGAKLKVPDTQLGKEGRCPRCRGKITVAPTPVPQVPATTSTPKQTDARNFAYDGALLDLPPKAEIPDEARGTIAAAKLQELTERPAGGEIAPVDGSRLPWPIDVFLYPLNLAGIIHLVIMWLLVFLLCPLIMEFLGLGTEFAPIVYTLPAAYVVYFLAECVRDSAGGNRRVPDFWMSPGDSSRWDCLAQFFLVVGCFGVCFAPVSVYYILREQTDWIYWLLLAGGDFFVPMVLLAVVLFDSFDGLNPLLIVGSIFRTFVPYCGMVLLFTAGAWLLVKINFRFYSFGLLPTGPFFLRAVQLYLMFVAVGFLGRFYQRHKKRLAWGV